MARFTGPRGKIVRKFGVNIYGNPKFDKLLSRKPYGPGQHGGGRKRDTEYGVQLKAKQLVRYTYEVSERKMRKYFDMASKAQGSTADTFYVILEKRLDNALYRSGIASTRAQARQLISHGFVLLNGVKSKTPSILLQEGDIITLRENLGGMKEYIDHNVKKSGKATTPEWMAVDSKDLKISIVSMPDPEKRDQNLNFILVTEFYSRI